MTLIRENPTSLMAALRRLLAHFSPRRRWQCAGLSAAMILAAMAELATLGAVVPFLALLADPTLAPNYPLLQRLFFMLGWGGDKSIVLPAIILFAVVSLGAAAFRMFVSWFGFKWVFGVGADIGVEVYRRTLYQPYSFHVACNTSEIIAGLDKVETVAFDVINSLVQSATSLVLSLAILGALVRIDPVTALMASLSFAVLYLVVILSARRRLRANSELIAENATRRVQAIQEGLGGIRDVLIDGTQAVYIRRFWEFTPLTAGFKAPTISSVGRRGI